MYKNGFIKKWRKEVGSDIWQMPPLYNRVWNFLLVYVEWRPTIFPTQKRFGIHVNSGQKITSLNNIADNVSWKEYGVTKTPNRKTIKKILEWLDFNEMISIESNRQGTYISICNWGKYQSDENEDETQSGQPLGQPFGQPPGQPLGHINKNSTYAGTKNKKKIKKTTGVCCPDSFSEKELEDLKEHRKEMKAPLTRLALAGIVSQIKKSGLTTRECIDEMANRGWKGFKADWVKKKAKDAKEDDRFNF